MSRLNDLIDRMILDLQVRRDLPMSKIMGDVAIELKVEAAKELTVPADEVKVSADTLYKWRGDVRPPHALIAPLVRIGVRQAYMDYDWAHEVLAASAHPHIYEILTELYSPTQLPIRHNLPTRPYTALVGRDTDLAWLKQHLDPAVRQAIIPIEGVGGSGKTALALEIGWNCLAEALMLPSGRRFDAIVFATAQKQSLSTQGPIERSPTLINLEELYRTIGDVLEDQEAMRKPTTSTVLAAMRRAGRVLLILDDLEDVDDRKIRGFLRDVPPPHKVIVTLRYHEDLPAPLRLKGLSDTDMAALVGQESDDRGLQLDGDQVARVVEFAQGLPLAATIAAGMIGKYGVLPDAAVSMRASYLVDYLFTVAKGQLEPGALRAWFALSFFHVRDGATLEALQAVLLDVDKETCLRWMHQLYRYNLVARDQADGRYTMLGFTHHYCRTQVAADDALPGDDPERVMEPEDRYRWLTWHTTFARRQAPLMAEDEQAALHALNDVWGNFEEVCAWWRNPLRDRAEAYQAMKSLWVDSPLATCGEVCGYWESCIVNLNWLAEQACAAGDIDVAFAAKSQVGRLLALREQYEDARKELPNLAEAARYYRSDRISIGVYVGILLNHAMLEFPPLRDDTPARAQPDAHKRLDEIALYLGDARLKELERDHFALRLQFYQAKLARAEGDLDDAKRRFEGMLTTSDRREGNRMKTYALRYLAKIALKRDNLVAAREYIRTGLEIAGRYDDKLQRGRLNQELVHLNERDAERKHVRPPAMAQQEAKREETRQAASTAARVFQELDMLDEAQEALTHVGAFASKS